MKTPRIIATLALAIACASAAQAQRAGQSIHVQYGVVTSGRSVDLQSDAVPAGVIVGGSLGLISAKGKKSSKKTRNALIGAAAGGVIAGRSRGDTRGMLYAVNLNANAGAVQVVTDQREIRIGDCVAVERAGDTANLRRVGDAYCEASPEVVAAIADESAEEADECLAAKQALVDAETPEQVEVAGMKMRMLCDS